MTFTCTTETGLVSVPAWVVDLASFRRWADSDDFPETGRVAYLKGDVWVDMSKEQIFTHVKVKAEYTYVLVGLTKRGRSGHYLPDGAFLSNVDADVANKPDGMFVSFKSLDTGRVRLIPGTDNGFVEVEGTPDMVLEIVSASSVHKDTVLLRDLYWEAGIAEYWLVDVRGARVSFDIFRHTARGYVAARKQGGWVKSAVFNKAFRLTRQTGPDGNPEYSLEVRSARGK